MDAHVTPDPRAFPAPPESVSPLARRWLRPVLAVGIGVAALVGTGSGVATAWDSPATAVVACAPDLLHWQATITVSENAPSAYTLTSASLDVMRWSTTAGLAGMVPGTVLAPGATLTAYVTGLPLGTAGAVVSYTGTYPDGRVEANQITLARPMPSCDDVGPADVTTAPTVVTTGTTIAATATTTTPTTAAGSPVPDAVVGTTVASTDSGGVLGKEVTATNAAPALANTGGPSTDLAVALAALALVVVGAGLSWSAATRRTRNGPS